MITAKINGAEFQFQEKNSILEALKKAEIEVPTLCSDDRLKPCGACVDACPTGALEDKSILEKGTPTDWTKTVCPYCGTGC
jgi:NADH dehydrogenase/NADH:ubiquinone oxidoreductase subunit G